MTNPSIDREDWLDVLALAPPDALRALGARAAEGHTFSIVMKPGVSTVRVRTPCPGHGRPVDIAAAPLARCAVRLRGTGDGGTVGFGYRLGRDVELARWMAQLDALLQHERYRPALLRDVVEPLRHRLRSDRAERRAAGCGAATAA